MVQNIMERLRPLVGLNGWDYCVFWKLSEDQRYMELEDCCCAGTESNQNGEELQFPVSPALPCRDVMFQHPRTKSCELLAQLPCLLQLDSGIHAQTFSSNLPRWLNFSSCSLDSNGLDEETVGTRVLIPVPGGLMELFIDKQVPEDQHVIDFVMSQCNFLMEQNVDRGVQNGLQDVDAVLQNSTVAITEGMMQMQYLETGSKQGNDRESIKMENGQSDSDCNDDEDDPKYRRRNGKNPQSKNLVAERKRRRKLNDRLYALRALVPKISKLDRASILGDAIEFVKELQKQAKELQDELEENSDDEGARNGNHNNSMPTEVLNGVNLGACNSDYAVSGVILEPSGISSVLKQNQESETTHDKAHQMEVQVEVAQIDGNEFFVKVFCEHKPGGFVRLMEALDSLGLEVTNANVTSNRGLVSNVFKVEKDSEMVQADYVRDSLLELTREQPRGWPEMAKAEICSTTGLDQYPHHDHHQYHLHHGHINSNHHHLHHL